MSTEKIANRQLFFILFMMHTTIIIALVPVLTTHTALQDAWLSAIVSFFGAAPLVLFAGGLTVRFPGETLVQYSQKLLGKWPGRLVSLLPLFGFLQMAASDTRIYAEALVTGFLTETPLVFTIGSMVFVSALAAHAGIEIMGRSADFFFPIFLLMILASFLIPVPQLPILMGNLEPVLARGATPVLAGSLTAIALAAQYMVITLIAPSTNEPRRVVRTALAALAASSVVMVITAVMIVIVLGPTRGARNVFPFLSMIRAISLSEFLERMEVLIVFPWGFGVFIGVAAFLYSGARGLAQVLGLRDYRPLIWPMAVIWVAMSIHAYDDLFQMREQFQPQNILPLSALFLLLPMSVLWISYGVQKLLGRL